MRTIPALALVLCGCSSTYAPVSFTAPTPRAGDEAFVCALRSVNQLGYTVEDVDREAGFIRAGRQTSGALTAVLVERDYFDGLTISIFEGVDGAFQLRATAASSSQGSFTATGRNNVPPSDQVQQDAHTVLATCGQESDLAADGLTDCKERPGAWRQFDGSWAVAVVRPGSCKLLMCDLPPGATDNEAGALAICRGHHGF